MTWPKNTGGGSSFQTCDDLGYHRLGAHVKFINDKDRIFVRSCRRCTFTYVAQIQIVEDNHTLKAKIVQLTPDDVQIKNRTDTEE